MNRVYELTVIFRPDFGVEEKDVKAAIIKLLGGRTLKELTFMGKKRLAYPIKKHEEGVYAVATIEGAPLIVGELEKQMKMGSDIIRYLLIAK